MTKSIIGSVLGDFMRYTVNLLKSDIEKLNKQLEKKEHQYRFVIELFNGLTWLSIATQEQLKEHCIQSRIKGGTPKEWYQRALMYMSGV